MKVNSNNKLEIKDSLHIAPNRISAHLTMANFEDNGHQIAFIPSLNLSAYGDSPQEAKDRLLTIIIEDFFTHLSKISLSKALVELEKLGWQGNPAHKRRFNSNTYVDKDGLLKNFNLPEKTQIETSVLTV